jgi:hypothetical protein
LRKKQEAKRVLNYYLLKYAFKIALEEY